MATNEHDMASPASPTTAPLPDESNTPTATEEENNKASSEHSENKEANVTDKENLDKAEEIPDEEVPEAISEVLELTKRERPCGSGQHTVASLSTVQSPARAQ